MVQGSHPERDGFLELLAIVSIDEETLGEVGDVVPRLKPPSFPDVSLITDSV
tara:strand:+ start:733 stop:888 length:156 start_codon:yes stop_codon:yes gene_type:complete